MSYSAIRESLTDQLMRNETIESDFGKVTLAEVLDEFDFAGRLSKIDQLPRADQQQALDDLLSDMRRSVAQWVTPNCDEVVLEVIEERAA